MDRMLHSEEAATRLGVKVTTLYAYVSRGMLTSHPDPAGRRSLFALSDIEQLATRQRGARKVESRLATITTSVTQLRECGPFYRGQPATALAASKSFEEVAALLWLSEVEPQWSDPKLGPCPLERVADRMSWAVLMCGATDPLRADLRPEAVTQGARRVAAALVAVVGDGSAVDDADTSMAARLARRLGGPHSALTADALNAALILMADHELATSTLAVRVAASTRADIYDALSAGLATLAGPLHGSASQQAYDLLVAAERDGPARALNEWLRWHERLPGFGHSIYKDVDPRFEVLMSLAEPLLSDERRQLVREVMALSAAQRVPAPNCDLALAALTWGTDMSPDAGRTIFTVARIAGWTAHYLEELGERPLRFRARAVYSV
ncbi:MAG TPA: citrate synthase [Acidimicrobiales bacterium]